MRDLLTGIPDRSAAEPASLPAAPDPATEVAAREKNRTNYLAFLRAGLSERLGDVLTWLEVQADFWQQDAGGDPRFPPTDIRAQAWGDPYTILDDAAARIEFSFVTGERDLGWRDGAMLSAGELSDVLGRLDNTIWTLENQPDLAAHVAAVLRGVVDSMTTYRTRTLAGCAKPAVGATVGAISASAAASSHLAVVTTVTTPELTEA